MIPAGVAISFLTFFALGLPDGLLGVAWPSLRSAFGQPVGAIAGLLSAGSLGYFLSSTSIGRILRQVPLSAVLIAGSLGIGLGLATVATAPWWWLLLPGYVLIGAGGGLVDAGFNAYAAEHFSATTMNWMHASFGVGATVGPPVMTASLVQAGTWRPAYAGAALFLAFTAFFLFRLRGRLVTAVRRETAAIAVGTQEDVAELKLRSDPKVKQQMKAKAPVVWGGVAIFFFYTGVEVAAGQLGFTLLVEARGVNPVTAGFWVSVFWFSLTGGRFLLGPLAHRLGVSVVLNGAFVLAVVAAALLAMGVSPLLDGLALGLLGFALAPIFPLMVLETPRRVGPTRANDVIGYQMGATTLGVMVLAGGGGLLAGAVGVAVIGPYILVLTLLCAGLYAALV